MFRPTEVIFAKNKYKIAKNVTWDDVIKKIDHDYQMGKNEYGIETYRICNTYPNPPSIMAFSEYKPGSLQNAFDEVYLEYGVKILHVFSSFAKDGSNFGRHNDDQDVLIVQSIGKMIYQFDDGKSYELYPGDCLYIPKYVYHTPIVVEPRVSLSYSW